MTPCTPFSLGLSQGLKASVVLAPQFLSHDLDQLTKELLELVKLARAPYEYPRKARPLGSHVPQT